MGSNEYERPARGKPLLRGRRELPPAMKEATVREELRSWGRRRRNLESERDSLVRAALAENGISKEEIHALTGLGRTTIDRIEKCAGDE